MGRYSFFSTIVFCYFSGTESIFRLDFGLSRNRYVYADESSSINSSDSILDSSYSSVNIDGEMGSDEQESESIQENVEFVEQQENNEKENDNSIISDNPEIYDSSETLDYFNSLPGTVPHDFNPVQGIQARASYGSFKAIYDNIRGQWAQVEAAASNLIGLTNTALRASIAELTATTFREMNWMQIRIDAIGSVLAEYNTRISAISRTANDNYTYIKNQRADITAIQNNASSLSKSISDNFSYIKAQRVDITALQNNLSALSSSVSNNYSYITNLRADFNKISNSLASTDKNVANNLTYIQGLRTDLTTTNNNATNTNKNVANNLTYIQGLRADLTTTNNNATNTNKNVANNLTYIQGLRTDLTTTNNNLVNTNKNVANNLSYINTLRTDLTFAVLDYKKSDIDLSKRIDSVDSRIDNLDKALIAALVLVNTKLDTNNEKLGLIYDRLGAYFDRDGIFTIAIREQFTRLLDAQETIFWTDGKVEENAKDGSFVKLLKALIYSMRYGLIAEFSDFTKVFKEEMKASRDNFNKYIELVNQNLNTSIGWLKLIYEKQINVVIPPITIPPSQLFVFDYDRLQKMFDGISFGDITNEAGKNIWDFLGELVKALADVVSTLTGLVGDILKMLTEALVPSDVSFISDELSKISSLFTKKFSFAIELKDFFTSMFEIAQVDFNTNLEFSANGKSKAYDISFIMPFISAFRAPLTALIVISNLFYCYKRVIGQGDVIA